MDRRGRRIGGRTGGPHLPVDPAMAQDWYYLKDGRQAGPVSTADLSWLARSGKLGPADTVWRKGMCEWKPVGQVEELLPPVQTVQANSPLSHELTPSSPSPLSHTSPPPPTIAIHAGSPTKTWTKGRFRTPRTHGFRMLRLPKRRFEAAPTTVRRFLLVLLRTILGTVILLVAYTILMLVALGLIFVLLNVLAELFHVNA
jgi:hypothetical protein